MSIVFGKRNYGEYLTIPWSQKCIPRGWEMQRMDTRIANRTIMTIEAIGWVAITIVMGLILIVIGASICGSLGIAR
jgi:hypothetical protein